MGQMPAVQTLRMPPTKSQFGYALDKPAPVVRLPRTHRRSCSSVFLERFHPRGCPAATYWITRTVSLIQALLPKLARASSLNHPTELGRTSTKYQKSEGSDSLLRLCPRIEPELWQLHSSSPLHLIPRLYQVAYDRAFACQTKHHGRTWVARVKYF